MDREGQVLRLKMEARRWRRCRCPQWLRMECFSLLFAGNQQREQGTVAMRHDAAGATVFLVLLAVGSNDGSCYFEAVFNRQVANS